MKTIYSFKTTVMKKFLSIMAITAVFAVLMASCKSNPNANQLQIVDTTGLAEFQAMKAAEAEKAQTKTIVKYVPAEQGTMTSQTTNEAKTTTKKGWSKAAKYGVIGGGGGAVLGAVINKRNRVAGGVIGGVIGGGIGYLIGRNKDKKEGRY